MRRTDFFAALLALFAFAMLGSMVNRPTLTGLKVAGATGAAAVALFTLPLLEKR